MEKENLGKRLANAGSDVGQLHADNADTSNLMLKQTTGYSQGNNMTPLATKLNSVIGGQPNPIVFNTPVQVTDFQTQLSGSNQAFICVLDESNQIAKAYKLNPSNANEFAARRIAESKQLKDYQFIKG